MSTGIIMNGHMMNGHSNMNNIHNLMSPSYNDSVAQGIDESNATNVIVNYLPPEMTEEELRTLFLSVGPLESCKLIRDKVTKASLGYAFINYESPTSAKKAIDSLHGMKLTNKTIKVSYARPSSNEIKNANLYVSGLPLTCSENDLRIMFARYGIIITAKVLYEENGQSRGVGFVRFDKRVEAEAAIQGLNNKIPSLDDAIKPLTVKFANPPSQKLQPYLDILAQAKGLASSAYLRQAGLFAPLSPTSLAANAAAAAATLGNSPIGSPASPSLLTNGLANGLAGSPPSAISNNMTSWCVFVYNLPSDSTELTLFQLFCKFGAIHSARLVMDEQTKKCKGYGFVNMCNYDDALNAIFRLNGYCCERGKPLQVSFKRARNQNLSMA